MAITIFIIFVLLVLFVSSRAGKKSSSVGGYFAANNTIHWGVNGVAFAGGYLSVASFLGIAGLIAFHGYDGFLYSIGFLAGWILALFVIAEPMKKMGTFTFSDALNKNYNKPGIQIAAGISVLVVSLFYLIPQMVGAGVLVEPLLGISHNWGVLIVGAVVILIVASGGMTSTTWVQFFNGGLLLTFAVVLTISVLFRGVNTTELPLEEGQAQLPSYRFEVLHIETDDFNITTESLINSSLINPRIEDSYIIHDEYTNKPLYKFYQFSHLIPVINQNVDGLTVNVKGRTLFIDNNISIEEYMNNNYMRINDWWKLGFDFQNNPYLIEVQSFTIDSQGNHFTNGVISSQNNRLRQMGYVSNIPDNFNESTGSLNPISLFSVLSDEQTVVQLPSNKSFVSSNGNQVTVYYEIPTKGNVFMSPGLMFPVIAREDEPASMTALNRLNFISLMLALFLGTSALPHILIRYYTVPSASAARKSTIVAIFGIGLFYILTFYLGLGSLIAGAVNPASTNMSAPLLARSFGEFLFAVISGIAFTTVLATVSGLIIAASGTVAHDLTVNLIKRKISDKGKVLIGRIVAVIVGLVGIVLGIAFKDMNVSFLVGWAFAIAASANLPSLLFMLFWKKTTSQGIIASIMIGLVSSVVLILLTPDMWRTYGLDPSNAPIPLNQPGIISIPLSFIVLIVVSLLTYNKEKNLKTTK